MYKTRLQKICPFCRPQHFSKWLRLIQWSVPLQCGAVSSCFLIPHPKICRPRHDLWRGRSLQLVRGQCCHFLKARNLMARKAVLLDCLKRFFCNGLWSSAIKVVSIWSCTNRSVWVINSRTSLFSDVTRRQCYYCMQPAELIVVGLSLQASILLLGSPARNSN
jgi:hypothetical protein